MQNVAVKVQQRGDLLESSLVIERRSASELSYASFLNDYVRMNRPVVIEHSVPQWKAIQEWSPEFFANRFGKVTVGVTYGVKMPMAELIMRIAASSPENPGPYLHQLIIHHHLPALLQWLSPENRYGYPRRFCSPLMPKRCRRPDGYLKLLIGGPGGKFPFMHYDSDNANAIITEIYGDKAMVLFSPDDSGYLYPKDGDINVSQIEDIRNPDLDRFPLFLRATPWSTVLHPGDTIFIPSKWWHSASAVTTSISVCTNMLDSSSWKGFVDWLCRPRARWNWPLRTAARSYFTLLGYVLAAAELFQRSLPGTPIAKACGLLSPLERGAIVVKAGSSIS
jgi:hypothetical protein